MDFIVRSLSQAGYNNCVNYFDDFCFWERTQKGCEAAQLALIKILRQLGFYVSFKKRSPPPPPPPATCTRLLGINIDSVKREISLPDDKLERVRKLVKKFSEARSSTKYKIDELAGLLTHCSKVVRGGRTFCGRIYDLSASLCSRYAKVTLTEAFREDIQ